MRTRLFCLWSDSEAKHDVTKSLSWICPIRDEYAAFSAIQKSSRTYQKLLSNFEVTEYDSSKRGPDDVGTWCMMHWCPMCHLVRLHQIDQGLNNVFWKFTGTALSSPWSVALRLLQSGDKVHFVALLFLLVSWESQLTSGLSCIGWGRCRSFHSKTISFNKANIFFCSRYHH
jgi:hypothetical protein